MRNTYNRAAFTVAAHSFILEMPEIHPLWHCLSNYAPFRANINDTGNLFCLRVLTGREPSFEELITIHLIPDYATEPVAHFYMTADLTTGYLYILSGSADTASELGTAKYALDTALMMQYAFASASRETLLVHASCIVYKGRAYAFLGRSGSGKSTHSRLWLQHIQGSELLNDDNPVVRIEEDGTVMVYGSPWSGKTPCYRNMKLPVGGFVQLAQAPYNKIKRMRSIEAYAALLPSISGKRWDRTLADGLHQTENGLISLAPVWYLECLPDEEAARLCHETITKG
jgi:hypothetical protein